MESESSQTPAPKLVAKSTAGPMCSFGIEVENSKLLDNTKTISITNEKKQQKLEADLERLLKTVSNETYQKVASEKIQKQHGEKVSFF